MSLAFNGLINKMNIDRKYIITAVNPCSGNKHTENDSVLFLAKDRGLLEAVLPAYLQWCIDHNCNPAHIESIKQLIERVRVFQETTEVKVPDTDLPCEIRRCVEREGITS